jgi:murein DD-endopeptidase MepM/ murein hydrolase activator NlpD
MRILPTLAALSALFALSVAQASMGPSNEDLRTSQREQELRIQALRNKSYDLSRAVNRKTRAYHALTTGQGRAAYVWEDDSAEGGDPRRENLKRLLQLSIRSDLQAIKDIEYQEEDLLTELEWTRLRLKESEGSPSGHKATGNFHCAQMPVENLSGRQVGLVQDFGTRKDPESGLEWRSLGWWLKDVEQQVRACAGGTVAFVGRVPGRERVVIIEHAEGGMTLYANLVEDSRVALRKGDSVQAGDLIGTLKGNFYFEARRHGAAVNPRSVFPAGQLARVGL